jgi:hypothetical protein
LYYKVLLGTKMSESQAQQDLAYIRQIMDESRSFATVGGNHFIIWGSVLSVAPGFSRRASGRAH